MQPWDTSDWTSLPSLKCCSLPVWPQEHPSRHPWSSVNYSHTHTHTHGSINTSLLIGGADVGLRSLWWTSKHWLWVQSLFTGFPFDTLVASRGRCPRCYRGNRPDCSCSICFPPGCLATTQLSAHCCHMPQLSVCVCVCAHCCSTCYCTLSVTETAGSFTAVWLWIH